MLLERPLEIFQRRPPLFVSSLADPEQVANNIQDARELGQAGMPRQWAVAAGVGCQQPQCPQFVRIAAIFGLGASLANQPGGLGELRRRPERGKSSIALSGPTAATGTARDPLAIDAERRSRLAGAALICQVQDDGGSFDMVSRGGARPGEFRQGRPGLVAQGHAFTLALPGMLHLALCNELCGWLT